jgi:hypothetical protein
MTDDLENELRNLKFTHLTESELAAYCDEGLDQIGRARVEAHLKQCFICEEQLQLLREESAALSNRAITDADRAFVERLLEQPPPPAQGLAREWRERLADYFQQMIVSWQVAFKPVWHSDPGEEVWRWQSADGRLRAHATLAKNADLIVHFASDEMELEGARLNFRLGEFNQELMLRRSSTPEVAAQVAIPWPYRKGKMMLDISIEIV